jgi:hypothetical protein
MNPRAVSSWPRTKSRLWRDMPFLLSVREVFPRKGGRVWYDDQRHMHQQIFAGDDELDYVFMGTDAAAHDNIGSGRPPSGRSR